jgi:hypothetical protein
MLKSDDNHILNLSTSVIAKDVKDQYSFWRKIIWDYSGRKLTMIEDRLPAISGVAAKIQQTWKDVAASHFIHT